MTLLPMASRAAVEVLADRAGLGVGINPMVTLEKQLLNKYDRKPGTKRLRYDRV